MVTATKERKVKAEKIEKSVTFLARYFFKATGSVVWHVRNGENKEYCVTINTNGTVGCYNKQTGEECPGHKYAHRAGHECHHILACQEKEASRKAEREQSTQIVEQAEEYVREEIDEEARAAALIEELGLDCSQSDEAYEAWKRANGLVEPLSRDEYVRLFDPCGLEV